MGMRNKEGGFTLVEIMIVIAVIGILMVVLIPRVGNMKENAKIAGVEANMRTVASQLELIIDDYKPEAQDIENLKNDLKERLGNSVKNPFSGKTDVVAWDEINRAAVKIYTIGSPGGSSQSLSDDEFCLDSTPKSMSNGDGMVVVSVYITSSGLIEASIYGYKPDKSNPTSGYPITTSSKVLRVNQ